MTPGECLRADMDAALARQAEASGKALEWTQAEQHHLAAAARAADRVELVQRRPDAELGGKNRATTVVKFSAELRALDKAFGDHLGRVTVGAGPANSEQHRRAVRAGWDRRDAAALPAATAVRDGPASARRPAAAPKRPTGTPGNG